MNNLLSYCGLVDAKMRASDNYLPVLNRYLIKERKKNKKKMVRITDQLLVSRAEHNEGHLPTLEEISLHQQSLDKIEYLNRVCADLKILQFQVKDYFFLTRKIGKTGYDFKSIELLKHKPSIEIVVFDGKIISDQLCHFGRT